MIAIASHRDCSKLPREAAKLVKMGHEGAQRQAAVEGALGGELGRCQNAQYVVFINGMVVAPRLEDCCGRHIARKLRGFQVGSRRLRGVLA